MSRSPAVEKMMGAIEAALVSALEGAATAVLPAPVGAVVSAVVAEGDAMVRAKNPDYFPGIAAASSTTVENYSKAPTPTVDTTVSPLNANPTDTASLIAYVVALNAKVDALIEATGHGSSVAMADHA